MRSRSILSGTSSCSTKDVPFIESITFSSGGISTVNPFAFSPVPGDSASLRHTVRDVPLILSDVWNEQSTDFIVRSPRLHDAVSPIVVMPGGGKIIGTMQPLGVNQKLQSGDKLEVFSPSGFNILLSYLVGLQVVYPSLPNLEPPRFIDNDRLRRRFLNFKSVTFTILPDTASYQNSSLVVPPDFSQFIYDKEYALLGYQSGDTLGAITRIQSDDTARLRIGMASQFDKLREQNYFTDLTDRTGFACVPTFRGINMSTIHLDAMGNGATQYDFNLFFAELSS